MNSKQGRVEVDRSGNRWLTTAAGVPRASAFGAPEPLIGIVGEGNRFASVGKSGTVYLSVEPLGAFLEVRSPPTKNLATQRLGKVLLATGYGGRLSRSADLGRTWKKIERTEFFVGTASVDDGSILALSVPEQWHRSTDKGLSFEHFSTPSMAPTRLSLDANGDFIVHGLYQRFAYVHGKFRPLDPNTQAVKKSSPPPKVQNFARASLVETAQAAFTSDTYLEISTSRGDGDWQVTTGQFSENVTSAPVSGLEECEKLVLSSIGNSVAVLCGEDHTSGVSPRLRLYLSTDQGSSFEAHPSVLRGDLNQVVLTNRADGVVAIAGLCPLSATEPGCAPRGVTVFEHGEKQIFLQLPSLPHPSALQFDQQGSLWALGARSKDGHLLLFGPLSNFGSIAPLLDLTRESGLPARTTPATSARTKSRVTGASSRVPGVMIHPGANGLVAVSIREKAQQGSAIHVLLFDQHGAILSSSLAPPGAEKVDGAGKFLLAMGVAQGVVWSSETAGLSWTKISLPRELCSSTEKCDVALACTELGCLLGDELSRVAWGTGELGARSKTAGAQGGRESILPLYGYNCRLREDDWTELPGLLGVPGAHDAALGSAAWAQVQSFPSRGAATSLQVRFAEHEIESHVLLGPVADAGSYRIHVSPQIEGSAALRYRVPTNFGRQRKAGARTVSVQVAWDNRVQNLWGQGKLSLSLPRKFLSKTRSSRQSPIASSTLISVAGEGLYLRMGAAAPMHFFSGSKPAVKLGAAAWPKRKRAALSESLNLNLLSRAREERLRIGDSHAALLMMAGGSVLVLGSAATVGQDFSTEVNPYLMGLLSTHNDTYLQDVRIAYRGTRVGFISRQFDPESNEAQASFVELGESATFAQPVRVPLQEDLKSPFRYCTEAERKNTPRVISPAPASGAVGKIAVDLGKGALVMETSRAVLFGTKEKPCVAVWEGKSLSPATNASALYRTLIYPSKTQVSWLFRVESGARGEKHVAARTLVCSDDDGAF